MNTLEGYLAEDKNDILIKFIIDKIYETLHSELIDKLEVVLVSREIQHYKPSAESTIGFLAKVIKEKSRQNGLALIQA